MGPLVGETELREALLQAGNDLLNTHSSTDAIFDILNKVESLLLAVDQDPIVELKNALKPSMQALVSVDLLRNPDSDVRVYVVSCLTEIMRITAPEAPYDDDQMKEVFEVTVEAFGKLADASCNSYKKAEAVLDTVAKVRSSLVMLDLECDDLILEMFRQFLKIIRLTPDCPQPVLLSMEMIMVTVIDESEEVSMDLLEILLGPVKKQSLDISPVASRLVEKVLISCACKLQPDIMEALKSTGTSLEMYSPVVSSICQTGAATAEAHIVGNLKETEGEEKISQEQVLPSDSLQAKLDLGLSPKGIRSKRTARGGARANGDDNVKNGNGLKQLLKQGQSESTDGETESGSTRKRKPNSLINPEEGYSFKTSSSKKKVHEKELGVSSLGKVAAKKTSLPSKVGQTSQSVVISLSPSSKARKGSRKRSRSKMEETDLDASSLATPASKKQTVKKDDPEAKEDLMETGLEKPEESTKTAKSSKMEKAQKGSASKTQTVKKDDLEDSTKTAKSSKMEKSQKDSAKTTAKKPLAESKKEKVQKGSAKTAAKKPLAESKKEKAQKTSAKTAAKKPLVESKKETGQNGSAKTSAKKPLAKSRKETGQNGLAKTSAKKPSEKSVHSGAKKKNSEGASMAESSESKKKSSRAMTPSKKESEQSLKRKRTAVEEVESSKSEHGEELVGKRVKVWWPLDKTFYDGVIKSYNSLKKMHEVSYSDGDSEELNLKKERWEIISEEKEEIDLPDSTPLSDIRRHKAKKRKTASMKVELKSSSDVRSSKKKDLVTNSTKQGKITKEAVKGGSNEPERKEEINLEIPKECDDKEESETKCKDILKIEEESNAESGCKRDHQEPPEESNAEAKSDGEEIKSANTSTAEPDTDGKEQEVEKEATAEPKTDGEEPESVKEPNEEPETEVQVREEPTTDTKLIEEDISEEKETGKVENEAEEEEQKIVEDQGEEADKAEGVTIFVTG
ncbi:unnamed protein product [Eruca vesicaria subsp. sativa]|uniref:Tudor domain-containing protein n=1 Tax=Eruca vesicaria subsp. sativa TaxID=29727 RepID=A0ABC8LYP8_ERUVS|nr:unnamed protein product [Eruca vesicaria subsp. sativa]